jgi:hypothetical protein
VPRLIVGLAVVTIVVTATCKHPTGLMQLDTPYSLRTINGQLLPYAVNGTATGPMVTSGTFTFDANHRATRQERSRRPNGTTADSIVTNWSQPGSFYTQLGRVVIRYEGWPSPQGGPRFAVDTLFATTSGGYILREGGMTLVYCPGGTDC